MSIVFICSYIYLDVLFLLFLLYGLGKLLGRLFPNLNANIILSKNKCLRYVLSSTLPVVFLKTVLNETLLVYKL